YRLRDDLAIIQTLDYFTPIVDDPYAFGQIAAANALSDVYAMGGMPVTAMNIVCFPSKTMAISVLKEVLKGGMDKLTEADVCLVGGHSVDDPELKYGLSITGVAHPDRVILNSTAKPGDRLILTKPLGTGIVNTAIKAGMADEESVKSVTMQMATLNRIASELMQQAGVNACTDVTGFGLLGHASEMVQESDTGFRIDHSRIPFFSRAPEFARMGLIPAGTYRNREFRAPIVDFGDDVPVWISDILFDPQTSGGLLISAEREKASDLLEKLHSSGMYEAAIIGEVVIEPAGRISVY
ncbi:MAG: selenide, water dikinase SelD, partial [Dehalococcoidia bacterium]